MLIMHKERMGEMKRSHILSYKSEEGHYADYGKVPNRLIEDMNGIIYYIETRFVDKEEHNKIKSQIIEMLESDSYDHGAEWRLTESKTIEEDNSRGLNYILSLVSFRVKDSY